MTLMYDGIGTAMRPVPANAMLEISVNPHFFGNVNSRRWMYSAKHESPSVLTLSGRINEVTPDPVKASALISWTLLRGSNSRVASDPSQLHEWTIVTRSIYLLSMAGMMNSTSQKDAIIGDYLKRR
jgi:hypothetical protein